MIFQLFAIVSYILLRVVSSPEASGSMLKPSWRISPVSSISFSIELKASDDDTTLRRLYETIANN